MKISHLLFLLAFTMLAACEKDEDPNLLHYDGPNATGPELEAGNHELAVRFPASTMSKYAGKRLTEVQFFLGVKPAACKVKVYGRDTDASPGALLYEADFTAGLKVQEWNKHQVSTPITLDGDDLWLSIFVTHAQKQQSIGCDSGPREEDGDWLFSTDGDWKTYEDRTSESVNWNIRGVIED